VRRAVAIGALLVIILLIALGVHSCQVSATNSALQDYTSRVSTLIAQSNATGAQLFKVLSGAAGAGTAVTVQNEVNQQLSAADNELNAAKGLNVPDQVRTAHQDLVRVLQMRADGLSNIATEIQPALGSSASASTIDAIAAEMARFYASDVLYKDYAAPEIYAAMHAAGVRFGGLNGGQFVPNVSWVLPSYIAGQLHVTVRGLASAKPAPGVHGHHLNSVSVSGVTLQTGSPNAIPARPAPTFVLHFGNTGTNTETNVGCKVTVTGTSVSGQAAVPQTLAGHSYTCSVTLGSTPPAGTQNVVATVEGVPGEKSVAGNSLTFPVTFQ
jgi:hypothetical protein